MLRLAPLALASLPGPLAVESVDISVTVLAPMTLSIVETPLGIIAEAHCDDVEAEMPLVVTGGQYVLYAKGVCLIDQLDDKLLAGVQHASGGHQP